MIARPIYRDGRLAAVDTGRVQIGIAHQPRSRIEQGRHGDELQAALLRRGEVDTREASAAIVGCLAALLVVLLGVHMVLS